ncbi:MAG: folate-binding protein [Pseudomonadota bacterium]
MTTLARLADRTVIRLRGDESRSFLQGLVTQEMENEDVENGGGAIFAALLTPQGKILFDFFLFPQSDGYLLDCHRDRAEDLVKRLKLYRLRAKIDIDIDDTLAVHASAQQIARDNAFEDPRLAVLGWRWIGPADEDAQEDAGAYHQRRTALGVPECGADFDPESVFLTDVNYDALNGVSYSKGCFVGQEVTSRMKRKGQIRRRVYSAAYDGEDPAKDTPVTVDGSKVGEIIAAREGHALALVRVDRLEKSAGPTTAEDVTISLNPPAYLNA